MIEFVIGIYLFINVAIIVVADDDCKNTDDLAALCLCFLFVGPIVLILWINDKYANLRFKWYCKFK